MKISIIVPIYNMENYLKRCIDSILSQTYKNIEIILIDDGSTDNSGKICDDYQKKDNRIKVIHKKNGGLSETRNFGIKIATGELIGFVDSDDFISEKMYEILYNLLMDNNADISICNEILFKTDENIKFEFNSKKIRIMDKEEAIKKLLIAEEIKDFAWNKLYKKSLFEDIKYPKDKKFEDIGTTYKLFLKANKIVYTEDKLYAYFIRTDSITNNFKKSNLIDYNDMVNERYNFLLKYYPHLETIIKASKVYSIERLFLDISMHSQKELFNDQDIKQLLNTELKLLKIINTKEVKKFNNKINNLMISILMINKNIFYYISNFYYIFLKKEI